MENFTNAMTGVLTSQPVPPERSMIHVAREYNEVLDFMGRRPDSNDRMFFQSVLDGFRDEVNEMRRQGGNEDGKTEE